jgi:ribose-phosphate pyrophosphokinase
VELEPVELHAFADSARFAAALARALGAPRPRIVQVHRFPDGERLVRVRAPAGRETLLVRALDDPDPKLVELLLAADALRRAGARRVGLVVPYLAYMRQDAVFHPGEPISQRVVGGLLGGAFDRVLTVEAHLHRVHRLDAVVPCRAASLSAAPALAAWVRRRAAGALVAGPDAESEPWVRAIAATAAVPFVVGRKQRLGDVRVRVALPPLPARVRRAVLVDDVASTGATLAAAARALLRAGVPRVEVAVVHALFAPGALARVRRAGVARVVSCDTVPHRTNRIGVAPLVAAALRGA